MLGVGRWLSVGPVALVRQPPEPSLLSFPTLIPYNRATTGVGRGRGGANPQVSGLRGHHGRPGQIAQIYEGINQIQRVVIARSLLR